MSVAGPSVSGFADALARKQQALGSDVVFLQPPTMTWPVGTAIDPETAAPYDPTVQPLSSAGTSATVRCGVFFKAVNRGGAEHASVDSAVGLDEHTRIFAIAAIADLPKIKGAVEMIFHGDTFQVQAVKTDEILLGYDRVLIYGAAEG